MLRSVTDLAAAGVDPCHPVILTARCDEAERRTAVGDTGQAARLLAPVLDRTLLAHARPGLGEAHPLLTRARTLAERLGITVAYTLPGLDEASLDLDVSGPGVSGPGVSGPGVWARRGSATR